MKIFLILFSMLVLFSCKKENASGGGGGGTGENIIRWKEGGVSYSPDKKAYISFSSTKFALSAIFKNDYPALVMSIATEKKVGTFSTMSDKYDLIQYQNNTGTAFVANKNRYDFSITISEINGSVVKGTFTAKLYSLDGNKFVTITDGYFESK